MNNGIDYVKIRREEKKNEEQLVNGMKDNPKMLHNFVRDNLNVKEHYFFFFANSG